MALDAFLQFTKGGGVAAPEIEGETLDREMQRLHPKPNTPFDIQNWSFGVSQDVNIGSATGGIGAGKVNFDPFKITKAIDKSSPYFFGTMCTGGHFEKATLMVRKAGAVADQSGGIYLQFDFLLVFVTNVSWSHSDPAPTEEITFEYGALQVGYKPQTRQGQLGALIQHAWSRVINTQDFKIE